MTVSAAYLQSIATDAAADITHVGLVDDTATPIGARQAVTCTATAGVVRPDADVTFDIPAGTTVAGWRAYDALTTGTDFGGSDLTPEAYAGDGTYTLLAASTGITHSAA